MHVCNDGDLQPVHVLFSFPAPPTCSNVDYTSSDGLHTISCVTHGSPPTKVTWEKDGEEIYMNDTFYQFSQALVNRTTSTYNNILTINATIEDVVGEYSCTATNSLGSSDKLTEVVKGKCGQCEDTKL